MFIRLRATFKSSMLYPPTISLTVTVVSEEYLIVASLSDGAELIEKKHSCGR